MGLSFKTKLLTVYHNQTFFCIDVTLEKVPRMRTIVTQGRVGWGSAMDRC
jgi:hypothetical protein